MAEFSGWNIISQQFSEQQISKIKPIKNEASNGLANESGTVAMARTSDPHSATNQFFINVNNNSFLNHKGKNPAGYGYAVFGKVIKGMEFVDLIKKGAGSNGEVLDPDKIISLLAK